MNCEHCDNRAECYVILGAMCGKTARLCGPCTEQMWAQYWERVKNGSVPWLTVPIDWARHELSL